MAERSSIEWTDATWNPWQGCTKVSPACKHCYMFRDLARYGKDPSRPFRSAEGTFRLPLKRGRDGQFKIPPGRKVFTCSWSDWFHEAADPWREDAWNIVRERPDLIFQIVTKRTERIADHLPRDWGNGWPHVWLMATVENQEWADKRIPELLSVPAAVRGLSIEPLLGPVTLQIEWGQGVGDLALDTEFRSSHIDWVIVGGESGPHARPMHPDWARLLRDQCLAAGVPFFFKQWGEWAPKRMLGQSAAGRQWRVVEADGQFFPNATPWNGHDDDGPGAGATVLRVGREMAGRLLDGRTWNEFPAAAAV